MKARNVLIALVAALVVIGSVSVSAQEDTPPEGFFSPEEYPIPYGGIGEQFSLEVYETIKDLWSNQTPGRLPYSEELRSNTGLELEGKLYYEWRSWACPSPINSSGRYRLEKFDRVVEMSGVDAYFGQSMFFKVDSSSEIDNCIGLYIFEDDYQRFGKALKEYECTTNHTPFKVGDEVYFGSTLRKSWGSPDQPLEVIGTCEGSIIAVSTAGVPVELSWEYFVRTDPGS